MQQAPTILRAAVIPYDTDCTRQETPMLQRDMRSPTSQSARRLSWFLQ
jgi:hypothetical protein